MGVERWGEFNKKNWKDNNGGMKQGAAKERNSLCGCRFQDVIPCQFDTRNCVDNREVVSVLRYIGVMGVRREFRKGERGNREVERGGLRGLGGGSLEMVDLVGS